MLYSLSFSVQSWMLSGLTVGSVDFGLATAISGFLPRITHSDNLNHQHRVALDYEQLLVRATWIWIRLVFSLPEQTGLSVGPCCIV